MHEGRHTGGRGLIMSSYVLQVENVALLYNKQSNLCFSFNAHQVGRVTPQNINKDNRSKMWIPKEEFDLIEITLHLLYILAVNYYLRNGSLFVFFIVEYLHSSTEDHFQQPSLL